jgi:hypothetical protein
VVVRGRSGSGELSPLDAVTRSSSLSGELGSSQGVQVDDGVLAITRVASAEGTGEHRFVLLGDDFQLLATSPRFCFASPAGEVCAGLAIQDEDLVISFDRDGVGAWVVRVPYEGVRALLFSHQDLAPVPSPMAEAVPSLGSDR